MNLTGMAKRLLDKQDDVDHSMCGVEGCEKEREKLVELKPFDPIDHGKTIVPLCEEHIQWAEERNELAEEIHQKFREYRKEIGEEYTLEVGQLQTPPDGLLDDAVQLNQVEEATEIVREIYAQHNGELPEFGDLK